MSELLANWEVPTVCLSSLDLEERKEQIDYHINRIWRNRNK